MLFFSSLCVTRREWGQHWIRPLVVLFWNHKHNCGVLHPTRGKSSAGMPTRRWYLSFGSWKLRSGEQWGDWCMNSRIASDLSIELRNLALRRHTEKCKKSVPVVITKRSVILYYCERANLVLLYDWTAALPLLGTAEECTMTATGTETHRCFITDDEAVIRDKGF